MGVFSVLSKEQSVLLSACQTLVSPHPSSIGTIPWQLFRLSCGQFVQIKPLKADVCYLYERLTACCRVISAGFFSFPPRVLLIVVKEGESFRGDALHAVST